MTSPNYSQQDDDRSSVGIKPSLSDEYQTNGFVGPICVLSIHEAHEALSEFQNWEAFLPDGKVSGNMRFKPHLYLPFVNRIAHHPKLVRVVQEVLQTPNVLLWSCDFNLKQGNSDKCFPPHQDATYAGLEPSERCVTAWVALSDPVHEEQGCLVFWPGSHNAGQLFHMEDDSDATNMLSRGQHVVVPEKKQEEVVSMPLRGGEASLHHFYTLHRSGPNRSYQPRVGLALRYCAASVRQTGRVRETVTHISGHTEHDGFDLEPILPLEGTICEHHIERGKEAHAEAMRRESANYFDGTGTARTYD